jgi:hypothetical protein
MVLASITPTLRRPLAVSCTASKILFLAIVVHLDLDQLAGLKRFRERRRRVVTVSSSFANNFSALSSSLLILARSFFAKPKMKNAF